MRNCAAGSIPDVIIRILLELVLQTALWPVVDSASDRNEYKEYFMEVNAVGV